jgi:hypothetical protein
MTLSRVLPSQLPTLQKSRMLQGTKKNEYNITGLFPDKVKSKMYICLSVDMNKHLRKGEQIQYYSHDCHLFTTMRKVLKGYVFKVMRW